MNMETIYIGTPCEFVSILFLEPLSEEGSVHADVEISVDGFQGRIRPFFEKADFERFANGLREVHRTLQGEAELRPRDEQFVLRLKAARGGHIELEGEAFSKAAYGNRLTFEIALDQTCLPEPIQALEKWLQVNSNPG